MNQDPEIILDELLVMKCRRGDKAAWKQLVNRYEKRLFYFVRRLLDNERDAWDVLQQTWLGAINGIHKLSEPRTLRTWLYRIARNNTVSHLRKYGSEQARSLGVSDLDEIPGAQDLDDQEEWPTDAIPRLHAALARLTVPHREVLTLHFLEDMPVQEIAMITNISPGTVKSRLHYAKRALRAVLEHNDEEGQP